MLARATILSQESFQSSFETLKNNKDTWSSAFTTSWFPKTAMLKKAPYLGIHYDGCHLLFLAAGKGSAGVRYQNTQPSLLVNARDGLAQILWCPLSIVSPDTYSDHCCAKCAYIIILIIHMSKGFSYEEKKQTHFSLDFPSKKEHIHWTLSFMYFERQ